MNNKAGLILAVLALGSGVYCAEAGLMGVSNTQGGDGGGGSDPSRRDAGPGFTFALDVGYVPPVVPDARPLRCDESGNNCKCISVASLGRVARYGGNLDNTDAFQTYLNTKSNAIARIVPGRTPLTRAFLDSHDVVILQALEDQSSGIWSFSKAEVDALEAWVRDGGGLITLTGYGPDKNEVNPLNQLLAFAGISYNQDDILSTCPDNYCYCTDSSVPFTGWKPGLPVTTSLTGVGVFHGRSLNCADCEVVGQQGTTKIAVAKQVGAGRVFAFADEWVTYTSQWNGSAAKGPECAMRTADKVFNVPQFWYNVIRWVTEERANCFVIRDPVIIP